MEKSNGVEESKAYTSESAVKQCAVFKVSVLPSLFNADSMLFFSVPSKLLKPESKHPLLGSPDLSPKRKRTRQTPSNSPATPDAPPHKRRR